MAFSGILAKRKIIAEALGTPAMAVLPTFRNVGPDALFSRA
jgi:hypothetical protein